MLSGLRIGRLDLRLPDGRLQVFEGSEPGEHGDLHIHDSVGLARRVLLGGELVLAKPTWTAAGTPRT